jgi:hypothetical protein
MKSKGSIPRHLRSCGFWLGVAMLLVLVVWLGTAKVDELGEARFLGAGRVADPEGNPLAGIQVALTLREPDPADPDRIHDLFLRGRLLWSETIGRAPWISDAQGRFRVRERARYGLRYHSFLGLWPQGGNPFKQGWLVLRGPRGALRVVELDLSRWSFAGWDYEKPAQPIPEVRLESGRAGKA